MLKNAGANQIAEQPCRQPSPQRPVTDQASTLGIVVRCEPQVIGEPRQLCSRRDDFLYRSVSTRVYLAPSTP